MVYDEIPVQRCWAHNNRNVLNKVRKADEKSVKADLHAVTNADTAMKGRSAAPGSFSSLVFDGPSGIPAGENV